MLEGCIFCEIVSGASPATVLWRDRLAVVIAPLNPVTPGHVIAIPERHATDFADDWSATSDAVHAAFQYARRTGGDMNLITSKGVAATQSVFHLHVHLVPRTENDGLALPWCSGKSKRKPCSCDDARWVDDENWQPEDYELARGRVPGSGRIPCGICNHGGWNEADLSAADVARELAALGALLDEAGDVLVTAESELASRLAAIKASLDAEGVALVSEDTFTRKASA